MNEGGIMLFLCMHTVFLAFYHTPAFWSIVIEIVEGELLMV